MPTNPGPDGTLASAVDRISLSRRNRFTAVRLDRLVEHRDDPKWVDQAVRSDKSHLVPLWRSRNLIETGAEGQQAVYLRGDEWLPKDSVDKPTLLGSDGKRIYFTVAVSDVQRDRISATRPDARFVDLRQASLDMDAKHAGVLAYAKALHYWQYRHRFCGICGSPNRLMSSGHRLKCSNEECARESFPRIDPAIIVLITHRDKCMLARNVNWPPRRFSTLAGFVEPGESLEDAVLREVYEESSVRLTRVEYVSSQPWPFPASAMCGFYAEAESTDCRTSDEIAECRWFNVQELDDAIREGAVLLSPPVSIAFRLLADWYERQGGGDLEAMTRRYRRKRKQGD